MPKTRFCNNDDEVRRGQALMRCGLRAEWLDGSERLCQETDESSTHYNRRHTSSESGVIALRPRQAHGRRTRVGSIRSIFREAVLPRRARGDGLVTNAHGTEPAFDEHAVDPIPIAEQVARGLIPRECLCDLACNPFPVGCDVTLIQTSFRLCVPRTLSVLIT